MFEREDRMGINFNNGVIKFREVCAELHSLKWGVVG